MNANMALNANNKLAPHRHPKNPERQIPALETLDLLPEKEETNVVSIRGLGILPLIWDASVDPPKLVPWDRLLPPLLKKKDLTLPVYKKGEKVAEYTFKTTEQGFGTPLPHLRSHGIKPGEMRDPRLGYPYEQHQSEPTPFTPRPPQQLEQDSRAGIFHDKMDLDNSPFSDNSPESETKTSPIRPRSPEHLMLDSMVGIFHDMADNVLEHRPNIHPGHGLYKSRMLPLPRPRPLGLQGQRSLLPSAEVVMAVQTSTGVALSSPSEIEVRFVTNNSRSQRKMKAWFLAKEKQSKGIFDPFLGRMRKRLMIDNDSKKTKHLEERWENSSAEELRRNPFFREGDENLSWEKFSAEIRRRYYLSSR